MSEEMRVRQVAQGLPGSCPKSGSRIEILRPARRRKSLIHKDQFKLTADNLADNFGQPRRTRTTSARLGSLCPESGRLRSPFPRSEARKIHRGRGFMFGRS